MALVQENAKLVAERENLDYIITAGHRLPNYLLAVRCRSRVAGDRAYTMGGSRLERVIGVCRRFGIPVLVSANKYDFNEENTDRIESYCIRQGINVAGRIFYGNVMTSQSSVVCR